MTNPISTITSAAFLVVAALSGNLLFGGALVALAISSAVFHYRGDLHSTLAHRWDEWSMYAVALTFTFYAWNAPAFFVFFLALAISGAWAFLEDLNSFIILPILGMLAVAGIVVNVGVEKGVTTGLLAAAAVIVRMLPETDLRHGAWHVAIAFALWYGWSVLP